MLGRCLNNIGGRRTALALSYCPCLGFPMPPIGQQFVGEICLAALAKHLQVGNPKRDWLDPSLLREGCAGADRQGEPFSAARLRLSPTISPMPNNSGVPTCPRLAR